MGGLSLKSTEAVIVLDTEGRRLFSKYYDSKYSSLKEQQTFERGIFDKTRKSPSKFDITVDGEILLLDGQVIVYKNSLDVMIYVVGSMEENEIILSSVLNTFVEALNTVYKSQVEKRLIIEQLDLAFLTLDETIEDGILLESDAQTVASRVTRSSSDDRFGGNIPIGDQTLSQALAMARDQLARSLLK